MADTLGFASEVFLEPPIFIFILGFVSYSTFWLFQNLGWEVLGVGWLSLSGLLVGGVGFFI